MDPNPKSLINYLLQDAEKFISSQLSGSRFIFNLLSEKTHEFKLNSRVHFNFDRQCLFP